MYNSGQPDVWYSGHKADLWVEYKFVVLPKRDDTPIVINLSELQKAWLRHRHDEGRSVGVMVGCKEGGVWFPDTSWNQKTLAAEFRRKMLDRRTLASIIERATAG